MDDVPDSFTTQNAPAPTTVEADDGPDQQGYRKVVRKQTFEGKHCLGLNLCQSERHYR